MQTAALDEAEDLPAFRGAEIVDVLEPGMSDVSGLAPGFEQRVRVVDRSRPEARSEGGLGEGPDRSFVPSRETGRRAVQHRAPSRLAVVIDEDPKIGGLDEHRVSALAGEDGVDPGRLEAARPVRVMQTVQRGQPRPRAEAEFRKPGERQVARRARDAGRLDPEVGGEEGDPRALVGGGVRAPGVEPQANLLTTRP